MMRWSGPSREKKKEEKHEHYLAHAENTKRQIFILFALGEKTQWNVYRLESIKYLYARERGRSVWNFNISMFNHSYDQVTRDIKKSRVFLLYN